MGDLGPSSNPIPNPSAKWEWTQSLDKLPLGDPNLVNSVWLVKRLLGLVELFFELRCKLPSDTDCGDFPFSAPPSRSPPMGEVGAELVGVDLEGRTTSALSLTGEDELWTTVSPTIFCNL